MADRTDPWSDIENPENPGYENVRRADADHPLDHEKLFLVAVLLSCEVSSHLESQTSPARGIGKRLCSAVILEASAVEHNRLDALLSGSVRDELADQC